MTTIIEGGFHTFYVDRIDNRDLDVISIVSNVIDRYGVIYKLKNTNATKDYKFIVIGRILEFVYNSSIKAFTIELSSKDTECTVWFIYR